ncbi:MAG TPA: acetyl-CoA synthetase [Candidatus Portnoybacteria bacterium]|nr:acetyl-CoA synthetase [Candidatus Portnoybacteria bacterium]
MFNFLETKKLLDKYELSLVKGFLVTSFEEAERISKKLSWPIIMKISNPKIIHKTDIGGVVKSKNITELKNNFDKLNYFKGNEGIILQPFVSGTEIIIGMKKDAQFGPVLMFGVGGIFVELLKDVSFRLAPINVREAGKMVKEIKSYPILNGYRGQEKVKIDSLLKILVNLSKLSLAEKDINQIDFNPVIANSKGAWIADAKIL